MPDDKKPLTLEQIEAAYRHAQRRAPQVPLHVHPDKGFIPGVPMRGSGPGGDFTADETHTRLTHGQYEAGIKDGILSAYPSAPAPVSDRPTRRRSVPQKPTQPPAPAPTPAPAVTPETKEGEA